MDLARASVNRPVFTMMVTLAVLVARLGGPEPGARRGGHSLMDLARANVNRPVFTMMVILAVLVLCSVAASRVRVEEGIR